MLALAACARRAPIPPAGTDALAYPVQGVDVSGHQGDIDWQAVAGSGIRFAWIKATEGGDFVDAEFRRNWALSAAAGVRRGAYHFMFWCRRAEDQAAWFIANVPADPDALPPVLDVEWNPQSRSCPQKPPRATALAAIRTVAAAMAKAYGRAPLIYAPRDFYADVLQGETLDDALWVRSLEGRPSRGYDGRTWRIWQHAEMGAVPGIVGFVDRDCFGGTITDWQRWLRE